MKVPVPTQVEIHFICNTSQHCQLWLGQVAVLVTWHESCFSVCFRGQSYSQYSYTVCTLLCSWLKTKRQVEPMSLDEKNHPSVVSLRWMNKWKEKTIPPNPKKKRILEAKIVAEHLFVKKCSIRPLGHFHRVKQACVTVTLCFFNFTAWERNKPFVFLTNKCEDSSSFCFFVHVVLYLVKFSSCWTCKEHPCLENTFFQLDVSVTSFQKEKKRTLKDMWPQVQPLTLNTSPNLCHKYKWSAHFTVLLKTSWVLQKQDTRKDRRSIPPTMMELATDALFSFLPRGCCPLYEA